jgi:NitT/TauT family transport system substrate-binding protein
MPRSARHGRPATGRALQAAVLLALALLACHGSAQELTIAVSRTVLSLPLYVAESQRYFAAEGVAVRTSECVGGQRCIKLLFDGQAQLATASELPVMFSSFARTDYAIVATFVTSTRDVKLIVRRSAGIDVADKLRGQRVGTVKGTSAHYFLDAYLLFNGLDPRQIELVPLEAGEIAAALKAGRIDAAAIWEPFAYRSLKALGGDGRVLPSARIYNETFNLVAGHKFIAERQDDLIKVLRALQRAQDFIAQQPGQAQAILKERLQEDQAFIEATWRDVDYRMGLTQSLVGTLEGQARWAVREGHVAPGSVVPGYLQFVAPAALRQAVPAAVTLVK